MTGIDDSLFRPQSLVVTLLENRSYPAPSPHAPVSRARSADVVIPCHRTRSRRSRCHRPPHRSARRRPPGRDPAGVRVHGRARGRAHVAQPAADSAGVRRHPRGVRADPDGRHGSSADGGSHRTGRRPRRRPRRPQAAARRLTRSLRDRGHGAAVPADPAAHRRQSGHRRPRRGRDHDVLHDDARRLLPRPTARALLRLPGDGDDDRGHRAVRSRRGARRPALAGAVRAVRRGARARRARRGLPVAAGAPGRVDRPPRADPVAPDHRPGARHLPRRPRVLRAHRATVVQARQPRPVEPGDDRHGQRHRLARHGNRRVRVHPARPARTGGHRAAGVRALRDRARRPRPLAGAAAGHRVRGAHRARQRTAAARAADLGADAADLRAARSRHRAVDVRELPRQLRHPIVVIALGAAFGGLGPAIAAIGALSLVVGVAVRLGRRSSSAGVAIDAAQAPGVTH